MCSMFSQWTGVVRVGRVDSQVSHLHSNKSPENHTPAVNDLIPSPPSGVVAVLSSPVAMLTTLSPIQKLSQLFYHMYAYQYCSLFTAPQKTQQTINWKNIKKYKQKYLPVFIFHSLMCSGGNQLSGCHRHKPYKKINFKKQSTSWFCMIICMTGNNGTKSTEKVVFLHL